MDTELTTINKKEVIIPERGLAKQQAAPADVVQDYLFVPDKHIITPEGIPIRVTRIDYIANFLTSNLVYEDESFDDDGNSVKTERLNVANMKALTEFLRLKSSEEAAGKVVDKFGALLEMLENKRGKSVNNDNN